MPGKSMFMPNSGVLENPNEETFTGLTRREVWSKLQAHYQFIGVENPSEVAIEVMRINESTAARMAMALSGLRY